MRSDTSGDGASCQRKEAVAAEQDPLGRGPVGEGTKPGGKGGARHQLHERHDDATGHTSVLVAVHEQYDPDRQIDDLERGVGDENSPQRGARASGAHDTNNRYRNASRAAPNS